MATKYSVSPLDASKCFIISGARDSQACANFAPQKTATDHKAEYPKIASAVVQKF